MKNPLNKRLPKELIQDFGKYLVIFVFMAGLISLVSGFLVADGSMIKTYNESFEKYNIEDGNIELLKPMNNAYKSTLEDEDLTLYDNFYIEEPTKEVDSTLRIFANREEVNKACLMSGDFPTKENEIAIDRMYAQNNELSINDTLTLDDKKFTITGLIALSDYSALFSNNSDMMFDSIKFGVAIVTKDGFNSFSKNNLHYDYSWKYNTPPTDDTDATNKANDILKELYLNDDVDMDLMLNFTPQYSNQAIHFTGDDMGGDRAMFIVLLYIVTIIIAFVFTVTTNNTITKEASIIGTLRASGYSKKEVLMHYITMPVIVTIVSAIVGNILGYTVFKQFFVDAYYGSYSLPTYQTTWNLEAFILTTIIPSIIMLLINIWIVSKKLELSPLKFLRHDLTTKTKKKAVRLSSKLDFFSRFRTRIILQNIPNYITMFIGMLFAEFVLLFGFMFSPMLEQYQEDIGNSMFATYQYILKDTVETNTPNAEKYSVNSLIVDTSNDIKDSVSIYGLIKNSKYVDISLSEDDVYISDAYAKKYHVNIGDIITLKNPYGNARYGFTVTGIYEYPSTLAVFMHNTKFNNVFNCDSDYFNGYFSNQEIKDISSKDISSVITVDDLTKVSRQLLVSMGTNSKLFLWFGVIMFTLLIYLLSKLIIEKNANSISMTKILGYSNIEIAQLYILATCVATVISLLVGLPLTNALMKMVFEYAIAEEMSGWIPYIVNFDIFIKMFLLGIVSFTIVAVTQLFKIKKIPMTDALKNVE